MEKRSWDKIKAERLNEKITRKMFWGEKIMVTRVELAPCASIPVHDHAHEQVTMVERGTVTLTFPQGEEIPLEHGEMLLIPASTPHGVRVGPEGCTVVDLFSPIREDFIQGTTVYYGIGEPTEESGASESPTVQGKNPYEQLKGFLESAGMSVQLEKLMEVPLEILARYAYERECITMGQLRGILGLGKQQAKELLRKWKHGDDHSESSYRRKLQRMIVLPSEIKLYGSK